MKSETDILAAYDTLGTGAACALRDNDLESYEVLANMAMALGWVLEVEGAVGPTNDALDTIRSLLSPEDTT